METIKLVLTIIQVVTAVVVILAIVFQTSKQEGLSGVISGTSDSFFGKSKGGMDALLNRITIWGSIAFGILTIAVSCIK